MTHCQQPFFKTHPLAFVLFFIAFIILFILQVFTYEIVLSNAHPVLFILTLCCDFLLLYLLLRYTPYFKIKNLTIETFKNAQLQNSKFLASFNHALRTPLNGIIGFTDMLLMKAFGTLTTEQHEHLCDIKNSAQLLLSLIDNMMTAANIDAKNLTAIPEKINCQQLISDIISTLSPLAKKKALELESQTLLDDTYIDLDGRILRKILTDLITTSIYFADHGKINIHLQKTEKDEKEALILSVINEAMPIHSEDLPKLFKPFERMSSSNEPIDDTRMTLYVDQKLANLINCEIEATALRGGIQFSVVMPISKLLG